MKLKHKINIADRNGYKQKVSQSEHRSIPKRLLTFLFGEFCEFLALTPGESMRASRSSKCGATAKNKNIELIMPVKAAPYDHQKKALAFACDKLGVFDECLKSRGTAIDVNGNGQNDSESRRCRMYVPIRKSQPCAGSRAAFHPRRMGRNLRSSPISRIPGPSSKVRRRSRRSGIQSCRTAACRSQS